MPASRSRTLQWRRCLEQIHQRGGAIEITVARPSNENGPQLHVMWRVRVVALNSEEICVESPSTMGQEIELEDGVELIAMMSVGQNRWRFATRKIGRKTVSGNRGRPTSVVRLVMPTEVKRCYRRQHDRLSAEQLSLPQVQIWPLLDPKSVVLAERASQLSVQTDRPDTLDKDSAAMPEVGPEFTGALLNIGGGGIGLRVPTEHSGVLSRHRVFWLRMPLPPELESPICVSAKIAHTQLQSDHSIVAGFAFDFSFNAGHRDFVVQQIRNYLKRVQERAKRAA